MNSKNENSCSREKRLPREERGGFDTYDNLLGTCKNSSGVDLLACSCAGLDRTILPSCYLQIFIGSQPNVLIPPTITLINRYKCCLENKKKD